MNTKSNCLSKLSSLKATCLQLTIAKKIEILALVEKGKSKKEIPLQYGIASSTLLCPVMPCRWPPLKWGKGKRSRGGCLQGGWPVAVLLFGVWGGVAMVSLQYRYGLPCLTLLRPVGGPSLKRPYGRFRGSRPARQVAWGHLLPFSTTHAIHLWTYYLLGFPMPHRRWLEQALIQWMRHIRDPNDKNTK
jgi:hypothetical protein